MSAETGGKRITAGVIFNAGVVNLVKGGLIDIVKENHKSKNKEVLQKIEKEVERFKKRKLKAMKCFEKYKQKHTSLRCPQEIPVDSLTADDLKTLIIARKRKSDKALPKSLEDLKVRWKQVMILSELNTVEHLLQLGYSRELIDTVMEEENLDGLNILSAAAAAVV